MAEVGGSRGEGGGHTSITYKSETPYPKPVIGVTSNKHCCELGQTL